jgi:hypothetical protein
VERIQDLAGPGIEDQEVFKIAQEKKAILLTYEGSSFPNKPASTPI